MATETPRRIPRIDFGGLDSTQHGTPRWEAARAEAMRALETYGCFDAVYDGLSPELRRSLLGGEMKELFSLPRETKMKNSSDTPYHGYIGLLPGGIDYESLALENAEAPDGSERFTRLMWPHGNPAFSDTLCSFAKKMVELDKIVQRMILESLGADKYYDSHIESTNHLLRLAEYRAPETPETKVLMPAHTDQSLVTIICQDEVSGLEVLTRDGDWILAIPSPDSLTVMTGDAFEAVSNGRLAPLWHRVTWSGDRTRHSSILTSFRKNGHVVEAPKELVDEEHPLLFEPYYHDDYLQFCITEAGITAKQRLKAFCGVGERGVEA